ncbi:helix-turn-helix domain-containing protein [Enterococcus italicus]|uniref:helix-turn-helix domain-containing protein n=1 Tax=Enterococcus italicus TaxID=246144 RepID=UPI0028B1580A|nr:helix-turn-helix domain-containing protein [Enterococcus italicus]
MRLDELLEKKEATQFQLLREIVLAGGSQMVPTLREKSKLSKSAFEQYIQELEELSRYQPDVFELKNDGLMVRLTFPPTSSLESLLSKWVIESISFQIIAFCLQHADFKTVQLVTHLGISESTLFRKTKELNKKLHEFRIQIKNGGLQGEELQIRYFYFHLYGQLSAYVPLTSQWQVDADRFVNALAAHLDVTFSQANAQKISLWLKIMQKRWLVKKPEQTEIKKKLAYFTDDVLYQAVDEFMTLYLSRTAVENSRYEAMLFYVFLVCFEVFEEEDFYQYDLLRSKKLPTAVLDTYIRETILLYYRPRRLSIQLEKKFGYQIAHINNCVYFFQGRIELYNRQHMIELQRRLLGKTLSQLLNQLLVLVFEQLDKYQVQQTTLHDFLVISYASVLMMIDFSVTQTVYVGVDFTNLPAYRFPFYQLIQLELKPLNGVEVSEYDDQQDYDLVISPKAPPRNQQQSQWYMLSEFVSNYDLQTIKQVIEQIRHYKN